MTPILEETIYVDFITSSSTGAAADADTTPTAEVFEDATDTTVYALTVTKRTSKTGNYRIAIACTAANGFEAGKSYNVVASATVGGIAAKAVVGRFQVRAYGDNRLVYLDASVATGNGYGSTLVARLTSQRATNLDNLDAAITTRMATYTQPTGFLAATFPSTVASTTNITAASGVSLAATGFDAIAVESGVNARQLLSILGAALAGTLSGAGSGSITFKSLGGSTTRITATTDGSGNRSVVSLSLPA